MAYCSKAEALRILWVSSTTFNKRIKKLGITVQLQSTNRGREGFITREELHQIAQEMNVVIPVEEPKETNAWTQDHSSTAEESKPKISQELQIQLLQKDEALKSKSALIEKYEKEVGFMQQQIVSEQTYKNELFKQLTKTNAKYVGFMVWSIALGVILVLFIILSVSKILVF